MGLRKGDKVLRGSIWCFSFHIRSLFQILYWIISAAASFIQTLARAESVSFTIPLVYSHQALFIKNPVNAYSYESYFEPLTYLSWGFVLVFLMCVPPFLYICFSYNPNPLDKMSLAESFSAVGITITMMGAPYKPKNMSARIIFLR